MLILYTMPIFVALFFARTYITNPTLVQALALGAILLHFAKRDIEVLFVHKYSGPMGWLTIGAITAFYSLIAGCASALNAHSLPQADALSWVGVALFVIGQFGNYYHHKLLGDLRKNRNGYHIPQGGLFAYVSCPHYLLELVRWLGLTLIARHLFMVITFVGMVLYLGLRSLKTQNWYQEKFTDYPANRKALIPLIF